MTKKPTGNHQLPHAGLMSGINETPNATGTGTLNNVHRIIGIRTFITPTTIVEPGNK
ncbi:hypothetical protein [Paenibacillus sp. NPDC057934]|uniref:hypothetical protein n=1 Tax=Paenibacillus sp. NPDC057934 TaxID=3346282 RepID=UPI0036DF3799